MLRRCKSTKLHNVPSLHIWGFKPCYSFTSGKLGTVDEDMNVQMLPCAFLLLRNLH